MSYHGRFENQPNQKRRRKNSSAGKIMLIVLVVVLLLILGAVAWAMVYYYQMMNKMNTITLPPVTTAATEHQIQPTQASETISVTEATTLPTETTRAPMRADDIVNILVVGQAAREGEESRMADSSIVVSLNTYTGEVTLFSVLRDTLVQPPDYRDSRGQKHTCGQIKFTSCYALGYVWGGKENGVVDAMSFANATLARNFGIEIDYNVEVSFDCFVKLVDYMGGVRIELTQAEADYLNKDDVWVQRDIEPGEQRLYGMEALCYARMRKAEGDSDSDIKRTARQRKVISALIDKVREMSLSELQGWVDILLPMITTTMQPNDVAGLLMKTLPVLPNLKVNTHSIPIENETLKGSCWGDVIDIYDDGIPDSVMIFDRDKNIRYIRAITEAETAN